MTRRVRRALEDQLRRADAERSTRRCAGASAEIQAEHRRLPELAPGFTDKDLYDEYGLPDPLMVVVDTSAILAMLLGEPEADQFGKFLGTDEASSRPARVVETYGGRRSRSVASRPARISGDLLGAFGVCIEPVTRRKSHSPRTVRSASAKAANAPPAVLNFGDLFAYALARHLNAPLLFKGNDFAQTDVRPALST